MTAGARRSAAAHHQHQPAAVGLPPPSVVALNLRACRLRTAVVARNVLQSWWSILTTRPTSNRDAAQQDESNQLPAFTGGSLAHRRSSVSKRDYLEARQVSLFQLFDGREFVFEIPPYQRPFCWTSKQVQELLQDFMASYHARSEYFLGAIVTVRGEDRGLCTPLQVIDGQQRLTTLLIMLAYVLAWARKSHNQVLEARVKRMLYLEPDALDPSGDAQGRFRLQLREGDEAFFVTNLVATWLPIRYQLAGVAATMAGGHTGDASISPSRLSPAGTSTQPEGATKARDDPQLQQAHLYTIDSSSNGSHALHINAASVQAVSPQQLEPPSTASQAAMAAAPVGAGMEECRPIENESWWRMYECGVCMERALLQAVKAEELRLPEFLHHVLTHCHVVLMTARDEAASFRIFSTLNSRGMDLSAVDKLKADLLEVLDPSQRRAYSSAWSEMEDVLGRATFHRVFDYMRTLALVMVPEAHHMSVLEYFSVQQGESERATTTILCALNYARLLLQLRQCRFEVAPSPALTTLANSSSLHVPQAHAGPGAAHPGDSSSHSSAHDSTSALPSSVIASIAATAMAVSTSPGALSLPPPQSGACVPVAPMPGLPFLAPLGQQTLQVLPAQQAVAASNRLLSAEPLGGLVTSWDDGGPQSTVHLNGGIRLLEQQARHVNLLADDAWVPPTLAFFQQVADLNLRTRYLEYVETLQLYLELCCDANTAAQRWRLVSKTVLQLRPGSDNIVEEIFSKLQLTAQEKAAFRLRLHHKDLYTLASPRTLVHLLLRAEGAAVSAAPALDLAHMHVERIVPHEPPEGSLWRKTKLCPSTASETAMPASGSNGSTALPQHEQQGPGAAAGSSATGAAGLAGSSAAAREGEQACARCKSDSATPVAGAGHGTGHSVQQQQPQLARAQRRSPASTGASGSGASGTHTEGFKYWFELQRVSWSGRLGNLILLSTARTNARPDLHDANYEAKAEFYRKCGVEALLPEWSGSVVSGQYARQCFSFEECKARHQGLHTRLVEVLRLTNKDDDPLEHEDDHEEDKRSSY